MMHLPKKTLVLFLIAGLIAVGTMAFSPFEGGTPPHENNLKVLPKDITHDELMDFMKSFTVALGFECGDCHARDAEDSTKLDFMSYANPHKKVALGMMKMVKKINSKYFDVKGNFKDNYLNSKFEVTCETCHRGYSHPRKTISLPIDHWKPKK